MLRENIIKPCLRWAGGKNWLIKYMPKLLDGMTFNNYHEPFLGGASVFLSIKHQNQSFLSDLNEELINTYITLKNHPYDIIDVLETYRNDKEFYYKIRDYTPRNDISKAARFIYLNQTSFNGIYRVNLKGEYNVPYGYRSKQFLDKEALLNVSNAFQQASICYGDFDLARTNIHKNDLVFIDPPYTVAHENNGFIKYNQKIFSWEDQLRLHEMIKFIDRMDAYYILTNAYHHSIIDLYNGIGTHLTMERASLIGGKNAKRATYKELLITNIPHLSKK